MIYQRPLYIFFVCLDRTNGQSKGNQERERESRSVSNSYIYTYINVCTCGKFDVPSPRTKIVIVERWSARFIMLLLSAFACAPLDDAICSFVRSFVLVLVLVIDRWRIYVYARTGSPLCRSSIGRFTTRVCVCVCVCILQLVSMRLTHKYTLPMSNTTCLLAMFLLQINTQIRSVECQNNVST